MSKEQWEEEAIARFISFLGINRGLAYAVIGRDVISNPVTDENFDYQIQTSTGQKAAVELFRLVESGEELAKEDVWTRVVQLLKQQLLKNGI